MLHPPCLYSLHVRMQVVFTQSVYSVYTCTYMGTCTITYTHTHTHTHTHTVIPIVLRSWLCSYRQPNPLYGVCVTCPRTEKSLVQLEEDHFICGNSKSEMGACQSCEDIPLPFPIQYCEDIPLPFPIQYCEDIPLPFPIQYCEAIPLPFPIQYCEGIPLPFPIQYCEDILLPFPIQYCEAIPLPFPI